MSRKITGATERHARKIARPHEHGVKYNSVSKVLSNIWHLSNCNSKVIILLILISKVILDGAFDGMRMSPALN